jgi:hypothetical protein
MAFCREANSPASSHKLSPHTITNTLQRPPASSKTISQPKSAPRKGALHHPQLVFPQNSFLTKAITNHPQSITTPQKAPCIIFIDEIDAIGRSRTNLGADPGSLERESALLAMLVAMDGIHGSTEQVWAVSGAFCLLGHSFWGLGALLCDAGGHGRHSRQHGAGLGRFRGLLSLGAFVLGVGSAAGDAGGNAGLFWGRHPLLGGGGIYGRNGLALVFVGTSPNTHRQEQTCPLDAIPPLPMNLPQIFSKQNP